MLFFNLQSLRGPASSRECAYIFIYGVTFLLYPVGDLRSNLFACVSLHTIIHYTVG